MSDEKQSKKFWFGPTRIGYGIRPQTWQRCLIVAIVKATIIKEIEAHISHWPS